MRLSILDHAPIALGQTAKEALDESVKLAQMGEMFGYTRYWIAEHHDLPGLACSAPEVMLGYIGQQTNEIRIGSGAVLLPHYKPFKVAEVFNLLATLFPNRVDLGIGRAPGGSAEATNALNDNFLQKVVQFSELVDELLHFLHQDFPKDHEFARVTAQPVPQFAPRPWILGTSQKSAALAAEKGLPYCFGQFMSEHNGVAIIQEYLNNFQPTTTQEKPESILTISVVCAEDAEKAEAIALSHLIWKIQKEKGEAHFIPSIDEARNYPLNEKDKKQLLKMKQNMIIGNPKHVKQKLEQLKETYQVDEIMIITSTHLPADRINSYRLIAEELL